MIKGLTVNTLARNIYQQCNVLTTVHVVVIVELLHIKFNIRMRRLLFKFIVEFLVPAPINYYLVFDETPSNI